MFALRKIASPPALLCLVIGLPATCRADTEVVAPAAKLTNAGFEEGLAGWSVVVYGAPAQVDLDRHVKREGKQALRVWAPMPSDAALGQEVQLKPGHWYRLAGWVRTRGLDARHAPVFGTFQVQWPGGRGLLAGGANHGGDTEWTEVVIRFQAPADGRVRIAPFFVGFGRGTGTAWFDDLRLEEVKVADVPLKITRQALCPGTISPLQYGQFIEYLCDLVPSMWAEKLYDGSFEGLSPYKVAYLKETDFKEKPWFPSGATNRATYSLDRSNAISGLVSQKIDVPACAPCTVGISQAGIAITRDGACAFSCFLRQRGLRGPVEVRLHRDGKVYASAQLQPAGTWKKLRGRLVPTADDANATLTIRFRGPGTLWLDNASLMPEDSVGGWRRDVVEAVRAMKPGVIRFGGSALDDPALGDFEWRQTVGDPDSRKPFRAWGGLQPPAAGLEEIVQFCRHVGAEPLICVRVRGRRPKDAADEVEYFNGSAATPMGRLRASNRRARPYGIKFWQVGNEQGGPAYEARLPAFCKAMRAVDPTIELLASYPSAGVLRQAADLLDYVCPHHYNCEELAGAAADLARVRRLIADLGKGKPIKVGVTEWNTTGGDWGTRRARLWTLENALACARYHNLLHRHADLVTIANRSNLCNSFCSGVIQTDRARLYKTPTYYAQQLYATLAGTRPLKIESRVPGGEAPDLSATLSADGAFVTVFAVNATLADVTRPLDFSAFGDRGQELPVWTLTDRRRAGEPDVTNNFAEPERVSPVQATFQAPAARFAYRFPALSLTVLRWRVAK
jgi:alpha-N-arabinofuranosidase